MHSRIFYLTGDKEKVKERNLLDEDMLIKGDYAWFVGAVADNVRLIDEKGDYDYSIKWLYGVLKDEGEVELGEEDGYSYIVFKEGYCERVFSKKVAQVKDLAESLTVRDFMEPYNHTLNTLENIIDDKFSFYFMIDEDLVTLNTLLRYIQEEKKYYIAKDIIDYHSHS